MQPRLWTVNALAVELGRDRRSLSRLLEDLEPDDHRAEGKKIFRGYRLKRVIEHLHPPRLVTEGEPLDLNQERALLAREQRLALERKAQIECGYLADMREVSKAWASMTTNARTRLLAIPSRIASTLPMDDAPVVAAHVKTLIYEALTELAHQYDTPADA